MLLEGSSGPEKEDLPEKSESDINNKAISEIKGKQNYWELYKHREHQLGVVDNKANNILMVDSVLIVISTLSHLFEKEPPPPIIVEALSVVGTLLVLASVGCCLKTIWIKWAEDHETLGKIKETRDTKKLFLHISVVLLLASLAFFVAMFVTDFYL